MLEAGRGSRDKAERLLLVPFDLAEVFTFFLVNFPPFPTPVLVQQRMICWIHEAAPMCYVEFLA